MNGRARLILAIVAGVAAHYFVFWISFAFVPFGEQDWLATVMALACGIVAGRFVWLRLSAADGSVVALMLTGALITGGIGFVGGFFGPMIFAPGANQGPLLGLFITGPLGFLLGGAGGLVYGLMRRAPSRPAHARRRL